MNIKQSIFYEAARQISRDIDNEILMTTMGWHKLELGEGQVHGSRYLTARPDRLQWNEMIDWMNKTFGPTASDGVWTPDMRWYANSSKFWFRDEKDLNWFILKWSK